MSQTSRPLPALAQRVTRYAHGGMIRFAWPVATLAVLLVVTTACGGAAPVTTPAARPNEAEDVSTFQPVTTPEMTAAPSAGPTDSTALLDYGNGMPTRVDVTLSTGIYENEFADGNFTSVATARECGRSYVYPRAFLFGFPNDLHPRDVQDVSFSALELLPGTSTSSFIIKVSIGTDTGTPVLTSLDTDDPNSGATGTAQLSVVNGTRTLVVDAAGEGGVTVHLTAVCSPI